MDKYFADITKIAQKKYKEGIEGKNKLHGGKDAFFEAALCGNMNAVAEYRLAMLALRYDEITEEQIAKLYKSIKKKADKIAQSDIKKVDEAKDLFNEKEYKSPRVKYILGDVARRLGDMSFWRLYKENAAETGDPDAILEMIEYYSTNGEIADYATGRILYKGAFDWNNLFKYAFCGIAFGYTRYYPNGKMSIPGIAGGVDVDAVREKAYEILLKTLEYFADTDLLGTSEYKARFGSFKPDEKQVKIARLWFLTDAENLPSNAEIKAIRERVGENICKSALIKTISLAAEAVKSGNVPEKKEKPAEKKKAEKKSDKKVVAKPDTTTKTVDSVFGKVTVPVAAAEDRKSTTKESNSVKYDSGEMYEIEVVGNDIPRYEENGEAFEEISEAAELYQRWKNPKTFEDARDELLMNSSLYASMVYDAVEEVWDKEEKYESVFPLLSEIFWIDESDIAAYFQKNLEPLCDDTYAGEILTTMIEMALGYADSFASCVNVAYYLYHHKYVFISMTELIKTYGNADDCGELCGISSLWLRRTVANQDNEENDGFTPIAEEIFEGDLAFEKKFGALLDAALNSGQTMLATGFIGSCKAMEEIWDEPVDEEGLEESEDYDDSESLEDEDKEFEDLNRRLENKPVYKVFTYSNGDRYEGEALDGQPHGIGKMYYKSGDRYEGLWTKGYREGYGCYYWADGVYYKGMWKGGLRHGLGYMRDAGRNIAGMWTDGKDTHSALIDSKDKRGVYHKGSNYTYIGSVKKKLFGDEYLEGYGSLYFDSGNSQRGKFENDVFVWGAAYYSSGAICYGNFGSDQELYGQGQVLWPNGDLYIGGFANGKYSGEGTYYCANGDRYICDWKNGELSLIHEGYYHGPDGGMDVPMYMLRLFGGFNYIMRED